MENYPSAKLFMRKLNIGDSCIVHYKLLSLASISKTILGAERRCGFYYVSLKQHFEEGFKGCCGWEGLSSQMNISPIFDEYLGYYYDNMSF